MDTDVLVVGAGPTGLMLANQLGRRGIRTLIIDRHRGPAQQSRAMAVQARTLEIYDRLGISGPALERGRRANGANMWVDAKRAARIPLGDIGRDLSPFPYVLMLGQDDNERILGEKLKDWGIDVSWDTELQSLDQNGTGVRALVRFPGGHARTVSAAYVAGCDGGNSVVRGQCGIAFPGAPYEHVFFVADTAATGPMVADELNVFLWRDGFHLFFPMHGADRWRVIGILPAKLRGDSELAFEALVPQLRDVVGRMLAFRQCSWFSTYRIHHRCAERFRDRRCFLLGDAAHVHSPVGGQGMNTGLQDAYNLAWKLALVVKAEAAESLLDSYEDERRTVAQNLLRTTDRAFTLLVSDGWLQALFRTRIVAKVVAVAMRFGRVRDLAFRAISQIGIRYRTSVLSHGDPGAASGPVAGDRFPWLKVRFQGEAAAQDVFERLDDTRFNLIVVGGALPADVHDRCAGIAVHAIADDAGNDAALARVGIAKRACFLLRPDGYIALVRELLAGADIERYFAAQSMRIPSA